MDELCFESCAKFGEIMDIEVIEEHTRKCVGKNSIIETEKIQREKTSFRFFSGEVGMDGGGLRRNFLSKIMDYGVRVFERLGLAIIQESICSKYIIRAWKTCGGKSNRHYPLICGLQMLE
ncbi:hypothetical protein DAPPUDRAFT_102677 [Daphnia pulex]|uniref:Uncharacterized protein n=1 Tax=Daphnia pulex TaxID=6669 RepID=E9GH50_DAPPU|nr:hypothetical protein DAPPUDRAFT_102677 [Daphnia pulex]|eukprot:EFX81251.1 hypothetical protein DAPPUDRAFT_102677 [Daphnia pulex]